MKLSDVNVSHRIHYSVNVSSFIYNSENALVPFCRALVSNRVLKLIYYALHPSL